MTPEYIGTDEETGRALFCLAIASFDQLPAELDVGSRYFVSLIVCDATGIPSDTVGYVARRLLGAGGVYFCTWGPGCERVHDIIDEIIVSDRLEIDDSSVIMTTWHDHESLEEALWYSIYLAKPGESFEATCRSLLVISVGSTTWAASLRAGLKKPSGLTPPDYPDYIGQE